MYFLYFFHNNNNYYGAIKYEAYTLFVGISSGKIAFHFDFILPSLVLVDTQGKAVFGSSLGFLGLFGDKKHIKVDLGALIKVFSLT